MASAKAEKWTHVKRMYALIIGIDEYKHISGLKGAVADADAMEQFLITQVRVPPERITNLRNNRATRTAIFKGFQDLWENDSIAKGDPIIIYFAGHGCEIRRPDGWDTGGEENIQGICPYDVEMEIKRDRTVFPIPDRTLGAFLNILSQKKGQCITVIFDCCHSASGVRGLPSSVEELERASEFQGRLPSQIDLEFLRDFDKTVPLLHPQSRSYVFLAACGSKEKAREAKGRGKFTKALLNALNGDDVDKLSFVDFMYLIKEVDDRQHPQCEGHFKTRMLFSDRLKVGCGLFSVSRIESPPDTYRIEAGLLHGVDEGSLFDMYRTADMATRGDNPVCCTLLAKYVYPLHTIATISNGQRKPRNGYALYICRGNALKVFFTPAFRNTIKPEEIRCPHDIRCKVEPAQHKAQADFIVDIQQKSSRKKVVFSTNLEAARAHQFLQLPETIKADSGQVARVLHAASQWTQHHSNISTDSKWVENIEIEFWTLAKHPNTNTVYCKDRVQPIGKSKNTVSITPKPDNRDIYGMVFRNNTNLNLYVSIVLFDIDELAIVPWFTGAIGVNVQGNADPSLPRGHYLTIGYGNSGGAEFSFKPPKDRLNVSILKLYFTTMPMDVGWLAQASPFSTDRVRGARSKDKTQELLMTPDPQCATVLFTVVQKA